MKIIAFHFEGHTKQNYALWGKCGDFYVKAGSIYNYLSELELTHVVNILKLPRYLSWRRD
jgi:hypothetical protein